jgi:glycosyltransferase involved in cell wall biosynthesis
MTGLKVECRNSRALAEAFRKSIEDEKLYSAFSKNCLSRFKEMFTGEKMVESVSKL